MTSDKEVGRPPAQGPADQMTPDGFRLSGQPSASKLLTALGFQPTERTAIARMGVDGHELWFMINPTQQPVGSHGRGAAKDIPRLNTIVVEFDHHKVLGLTDDEAKAKLTDEQRTESAKKIAPVLVALIRTFGVEPTMVVGSGHRSEE